MRRRAWGGLSFHRTWNDQHPQSVSQPPLPRHSKPGGPVERQLFQAIGRLPGVEVLSLQLTGTSSAGFCLLSPLFSTLKSLHFTLLEHKAGGDQLPNLAPQGLREIRANFSDTSLKMLKPFLNRLVSGPTHHFELTLWNFDPTRPLPPSSTTFFPASSLKLSTSVFAPTYPPLHTTGVLSTSPRKSGGFTTPRKASPSHARGNRVERRRAFMSDAGTIWKRCS